MRTKQLESIIEAILFTMGDSVEVSKIASAIEQDVPTTEKLIHNMMDKYQKEERGIRIIELDHAYQLCSKPEMYEYLIRIAKQPRKQVLTDVLLETLSIVAYKQPVTKVEIEKIRGVSCEHAINKLLDYGLIQEAGRLDAPGRPILFGTTEEFLRCFDVQSVEELPDMNPEKIEELKQEEQRNWENLSLEEHMEVYEKQGISRKEAMKLVAKDRGISRRDVYQALLS